MLQSPTLMYKITGEDIPARLRELPQPPKALYLRGELPAFADYKYLTVVGSRRFSNYGKDACEKLLNGLAGYPIVIVSGLALGIDAIAHRAALRAGLPTVGMPGSGLDPGVIAPRTNALLAEEILKSSGALLSEYEPKARVYPSNFPERNRLMVGLSDAVLIIEAGERSGTLITARMATDYNRDLYVVPGPIFSPHCAGSNRFMKEGAMPVCSSDDLLTELGFETKKNAQRSFDFSDTEQLIVDLLHEPCSRDALIRESGLSAQECTTLLVAMEIKGLIREHMGEIHLA